MPSHFCPKRLIILVELGATSKKTPDLSQCLVFLILKAIEHRLAQ